MRCEDSNMEARNFKYKTMALLIEIVIITALCLVGIYIYPKPSGKFWDFTEKEKTKYD